ncbi:hypothetical protein [Streptomyces hirsutus]
MAALEGIAAPLTKRVTQFGSDIISPITDTLTTFSDDHRMTADR